MALHVGMARFAYGVVLPSLRTEMGLGYTAGGVLNALHLAGYLVGTLLGPGLIRRYGVSQLVVAAHLLVAMGAFLCALAPANPGFGVVLLGIGRIATGVGAGPAVIAIMVSVLSSVAEPSRASASVLMWIGMAIAILGCGAGAPWLLQPGAWRLVFVAAALVALVLAFGFPVAKAMPGDSGAGQGFTFASIATPRWAWLVLTTCVLVWATSLTQPLPAPVWLPQPRRLLWWHGPGQPWGWPPCVAEVLRCGCWVNLGCGPTPCPPPWQRLR